jgi:hypothetical protein
MLSGFDYDLTKIVYDRQIRSQKACEKAIRNMRSKHPGGSYTREMCAEVLLAGSEYDILNRKAGLAQRSYSAEGIKHYQDQLEVSLVRLLVRH